MCVSYDIRAHSEHLVFSVVVVTFVCREGIVGLVLNAAAVLKQIISAFSCQITF